MESVQRIDQSVYDGLHSTLASARLHKSWNIYSAFQNIQNNNDHLQISQNICEKSLELLDDALTKLCLISFNAEQLWGFHHYLDNSNCFSFILQNNGNLFNLDHQDILIFISLLDQSLFSCRSFLDLYLKYLLFISTGVKVNNISTKVFSKRMNKYINEKPTDQNASIVLDYINKNVLNKTYGGSKQCWGDFLRELRDKTSHNKIIRPSIKPRKNQNGSFVSFPTIQGKEFTDLVNDFEIGAIDMIYDIDPILNNILDKSDT